MGEIIRFNPKKLNQERIIVPENKRKIIVFEEFKRRVNIEKAQLKSLENELENMEPSRVAERVYGFISYLSPALKRVLKKQLISTIRKILKHKGKYDDIGFFVLLERELIKLNNN